MLPLEKIRLNSAIVLGLFNYLIIYSSDTVKLRVGDLSTITTTFMIIHPFGLVGENRSNRRKDTAAVSIYLVAIIELLNLYLMGLAHRYKYFYEIFDEKQ